MDQRPEQPPEGKLIADAASRLDISIREAARRAGLSYGRWRQVTQGYQNISPGVFAPVHAPAKTVAKMAAAVGVTPAELAGTGRDDAAEVLEAMQRRDAAGAADSLAVVAAPRPAPAGPPRRDVDFTAGIPGEELRPYTEGVLEEAYVALADLFAGELPGLDDPAVLETMLGLPGKAVFPENSNEQRVWDDPVYSPRERVDLIARFRLLRARMAREQRRRTGTGLTDHIPATGAIPALVSVGGRALRASS